MEDHRFFFRRPDGKMTSAFMRDGVGMEAVVMVFGVIHGCLFWLPLIQPDDQSFVAAEVNGIFDGDLFEFG